MLLNASSTAFSSGAGTLLSQTVVTCIGGQGLGKCLCVCGMHKCKYVHLMFDIYICIYTYIYIYMYIERARYASNPNAAHKQDMHIVLLLQSKARHCNTSGLVLLLHRHRRHGAGRTCLKAVPGHPRLTALPPNGAEPVEKHGLLGFGRKCAGLFLGFCVAQSQACPPLGASDAALLSRTRRRGGGFMP